MKYCTLEAAEDEYDITPGFVFANLPAYEGRMADRGDLMIAHDIIEHQNGLQAIGPIWDELEALGGVWHTRGRWGDFDNSYHKSEKHIASDITRMARDLSFLYFRDYEAMGPKPPATHEHYQDDSFHEILEIARRDIPRELDEDSKLDIDTYLAEALHRLRIGYRKATRRFGDRFQSNNQFHAIREAIEREAKSINYVGQRFRLGWGAGKCSIEPIYEEEFY